MFPKQLEDLRCTEEHCKEFSLKDLQDNDVPIFCPAFTDSSAGLGLGTFLGKTLLERQNAKLLFKEDKNLGGASVVISWSPKNILITA